jgi:hypothetical protein
VRNAANQSHEIELVKLLPGKSTQDLLGWLEKMQGEPVGIAVGGVSPLAPSGQSMFTVNLAPAKYVLLCFLPDARDHKSHLSHGMVQEIEVGEQLARYRHGLVRRAPGRNPLGYKGLRPGRLSTGG